MKAILRVSLVAIVCGFGMSAASDADARDCFLKKIFNRGNDCCSPCEPVCCEPAPQPCCQAPVADCGCGAVEASYSDCGCGAVTGEIIIEDSYQPTEAASPSDEMPEVPEPPAAEEATEEAAEEAAEAAAEATTEA